MPRFWYLLLSLAWGLTAVSVANAAEAKVAYPTKAASYEYFELNATQSSASAGLEWQIADREIEAWYSPDRRRVLLRVPTPRLVQVILIARDLDSHNDVRIVSIAITDQAVPIPPKPPPPVPQPIPDPQPTPAPQPTPQPTVPAGRFGIAAEVLEQAAKITSPTRREDAEQIAKVALSVRDQFTSGKLQPTTMLQVGRGIETAVNTLPQEIQQRWLPTFGAWWTSKLRELWMAGQLKTVADWRDVLEETAAGLRLVK